MSVLFILFSPCPRLLPIGVLRFAGGGPTGCRRALSAAPAEVSRARSPPEDQREEGGVAAREQNQAAAEPGRNAELAHDDCALADHFFAGDESLDHGAPPFSAVEKQGACHASCARRSDSVVVGSHSSLPGPLEPLEKQSGPRLAHPRAMNRRRFLMAIFALAATAAGALEPDQVFITYGMKMGTRQVSGVSRELEWSFVALDDAHALMRVRVPIDSFDSGHDDFDSALRKAIRSDRHPFVQIDGIARQGQIDGTLELAGVSRPVSVRLHAERVAGNVIAVASLTIDLRD